MIILVWRWCVLFNADVNLCVRKTHWHVRFAIQVSTPPFIFGPEVGQTETRERGGGGVFLRVPSPISGTPFTSYIFGQQMMQCVHSPGVVLKVVSRGKRPIECECLAVSRDLVAVQVA